MTPATPALSKSQKIWAVALTAFVVFALLVWHLAPRLKLHGNDIWVFRIGLWLLGLIATGVVIWLQLRKLAPAAAAPGADDIDVTAAAARRQLSGSRRARSAGTSSLAALPMIVVLGPEGSTKTTSVIRSGLDPELLAGGVMRGDTVAPTSGINVWFSQGTVFLEAGGPAFADSARFARVIRHAQPGRLRAVFGGGAQPPRLAVACMSCEEFLKPGASETVMGLARAMRERLSQLSRALGVQLPVYVIFTKADRIPYFADYFQNLSNDESRDVLGVTLAPDAGAAGLYADRQTARVGGAFDQLFRSLAEKRLQLLARENAAERKPGAYEFPRELRKLMPLAQDFLVELCKPSQLQVSPFLRGFYFAGVRAVIITESAVAAAPAAQRARGGPVGATSVFDAQAQAAAQAGAPAAATARKVPQWLFLDRLFSDVLLKDHAAMKATSGGTRVNVLRRALLGMATVVGVLLAAGVAWSYSNNRQLDGSTLGAARAAAALPAASQDLPAADALARLDSLRQRLVALDGYATNGAPVRLRFGLFTGSRVLADARQLYFAAFNRVMLQDTRRSMAATLAALPATPRPTDQYDSTYSLFKGYLITTRNNDKSTQQFLVPVLMSAWLQGRPLDSTRTRLAEQQFAYYANRLTHANPYTAPADDVLITHTRAYLNQWAGAERIYQFMLSEAGKSNPAVQFNRLYPRYVALVSDDYEVPGAFTKGGYAFMQNAFKKDADRYFNGETWVLGDQAAGQLDKNKVIAQLAVRYDSAYQEQWRTYLRHATVRGFGGIADAASKLQTLAGPQSPLLAVIALASQNTPADTQLMQPTHVVVPANVTDKLIGPTNQDYMNALLQVQTALGQVNAAPPNARDALVSQASGSVANAQQAALKLAQGFKVAGDGAVSTAVTGLLNAPLKNLEPFLRNYGAGQANGGGASFCAQVGSVLAKFPFNPSATAQATPQEVATVFKPGTGALWTYYNASLAAVLTRQGSDYVPTPGASIQVSPQFLSFFNRAAKVSDALFPQGASEPRFTFSLRSTLTEGVSGAVVAIDGAQNEYAKGAQHTYTWSANPAGLAWVGGTSGTSKQWLQQYQGTWAVFQLFDHADHWATQGGTTSVEWSSTGGGELRVGFDFDNATFPAVLRRGFFDGFRCVSRVAQ
jgi:type VI secretion system protein ImpL